MTAGNNPREFVRLLKILYKANGLPTFIIPEEVFNAPGSTPTTDPVEDADSTSDDDDSATAMQTSDPVRRVPTMQPPSAAVPTTATQPPRTQPSRHQPSSTQPSRTLPQRVNTLALHSSDESDEDVSVGTPSPSRKDHFQASTRNVTTKTDKPKKKTNDQSLVKSTRKKTTNELT
nr:mucin-7-like [Procambarus clarkii]